MTLSNWLGSTKAKKRHARLQNRRLRIGETVAFDVVQNGNRVDINADGIGIYFAVDGIALPDEIDATFAAWALLALAMEQGFNIHIKRPIIEKLRRTPNACRNFGRCGRRAGTDRSGLAGRAHGHGHRASIYPTFSCIRAASTPPTPCSRMAIPRSAATLPRSSELIRATRRLGFKKLIAMTDPLLERLNCQRIIIRTDANRKPSEYAHGFTLAASLFLLSELFEGGAIAADRTLAQDMVTFPWGTNHVVNPYFSGSDFTVRSIGHEIGRTEKIAALAEAKIDFSILSFCRQRDFIPDNCGVCNKCIRTKAMFLAVTGTLPDIFVDMRLDEELMRKLHLKRNERTHAFDLYFYAKERGILDFIPGLASLVEHYRRLDLAGWSAGI